MCLDKFKTLGLPVVTVQLRVLARMGFTFAPDDEDVYLLCCPDNHVIMLEHLDKSLWLEFRPRFKEIFIEVNFTSLEDRRKIFLLPLFDQVRRFVSTGLTLFYPWPFTMY